MLSSCVSCWVDGWQLYTQAHTTANPAPPLACSYFTVKNNSTPHARKLKPKHTGGLKYKWKLFAKCHWAVNANEEGVDAFAGVHQWRSEFVLLCEQRTNHRRGVVHMITAGSRLLPPAVYCCNHGVTVILCLLQCQFKTCNLSLWIVSSRGLMELCI